MDLPRTRHKAACSEKIFCEFCKFIYNNGLTSNPPQSYMVSKGYFMGFAKNIYNREEGAEGAERKEERTGPTQ
jgi:hypothetical protein